MKRFTGILLLSLIASCKKSVEQKPDYIPVIISCKLTRNIDSAKMLIQGKWEWLQEKRAVRGQGSIYLTPQTEGANYEIVFSNDTAFGYKDGILTDTSKFKFGLESEFSNYPLDTLPVYIGFDIHTGLRQHYVPFKICNDYLLFQQQYVTSIAGEFTYKKK